MENAPSRTAFGTAFARAVHLRVDDPPPVLGDGVAERLLPGYQQRYIRRLGALTRFWRGYYIRQADAFTALRSQVVVRSRYAEDALAAAHDGGTERYVILAAGLDTFALRQPASPMAMARATAIEVLEIDHPATQGWKRELLRTRGLDVPAELAFLPIDFETESLAGAWPTRPAPDFVSWLGATYYLTRDAIAGTLETLTAATAPGSRLVLDYWSARPPTAAGNLLLWGTRMAVALQQEPMLSFFEPEEIESLAAAAGWSVLENLDAADQNERYLHGRRDGLVVPSFAHLLQIERTADD